LSPMGSWVPIRMYPPQHTRRSRNVRTVEGGQGANWGISSNLASVRASMPDSASLVSAFSGGGSTNSRLSSRLGGCWATPLIPLLREHEGVYQKVNLGGMTALIPKGVTSPTQVPPLPLPHHCHTIAPGPEHTPVILPDKEIAYKKCNKMVDLPEHTPLRDFLPVCGFR
jgi:hypothetical protein